MGDEEEYNGTPEDLYTPTQEKLLTIIPMIASFISVVCSICIIKTIWAKRTLLLPQVYHRTIFIISILDVISSTNALFSSFLVPRGSPDVFGASGNITTCEISGILWQLSYTIPLYNAALSFYFVLQVRYQVQDRFFARYLEPIIHFICVCYAIFPSIVGVMWGIYNSLQYVGGWCVAASSGCHGTGNCTRRSKVDQYVFTFYVPMFFTVISSLVVNMIILYITVRNQEKRLHRYDSLREMTLSKKVGARGIKFIAAFLLTYFWNLWIFALYANYRGFVLFFCILLMKIFVPLQGFWAFLIYFESKVKKNVKRYAESSLAFWSSSMRRGSTQSFGRSISMRERTTPYLEESEPCLEDGEQKGGGRKGYPPPTNLTYNSSRESCS